MHVLFKNEKGRTSAHLHVLVLTASAETHNMTSKIMLKGLLTYLPLCTMTMVCDLCPKKTLVRAYGWTHTQMGSSKNEREIVVYVGGGLNRWLEHRLIRDGIGIKLLLGWDFS